MGVERVGQVIYRVRDMDAAEAFYRDVVGLKLKFRDGNEWAAFDGGATTFALEGQADTGAEADRAGQAVVAFRVNGLQEFARNLERSGASPGTIAVGPHESRFSVTDPSGNQVVFYEPAPRK